MKTTTQAIYNLITAETFEYIDKKLNDVIERNSWEVSERNEYSLNELLEDLPNLVDIVKTSCEDGIMDRLIYSVRSSFQSSISRIKTTVEQIYQNSNQFPALMDLTMELINSVRAYRLDFESKKIPRYNQKIREYEELIEKLKTYQEQLKIVLVEREHIKDLLNSSTADNEEIQEIKASVEEVLKKSSEKLSKIEEIDANATEYLSEIKNTKDNASIAYDEIGKHKIEAEKKKDDILEFFEKIDSYVETMEKNKETIAQRIQEYRNHTEETIREFESRTELLINKNEQQAVEIDKQLEKAVGASLFGSFNARKVELSPQLNKWLIGIAVTTMVLVFMSYLIFNDLNILFATQASGELNASINIGSVSLAKHSADMSGYSHILLILKITMTFPLIYAIAFMTSRYAKERRLVEEYAFKSTISLALSPYADLVAKVEKEGGDSKYRDFLIESINNIFSIPTDKAFGYNKKDTCCNEGSIEKLEKSIGTLEKIKKIFKGDE